jgi:preprotein translocase subunit YajC
MLNHIDGIELQDVLDYILKCKDNEKLSTITSAVRDKRKYNASHLKYSLKVGDKVRITGSGNIDKGTITKVNRTRAVVKIEIEGELPVSYNVPFTMISKEVSNG